MLLGIKPNGLSIDCYENKRGGRVVCSYKTLKKATRSAFSVSVSPIANRAS